MIRENFEKPGYHRIPGINPGYSKIDAAAITGATWPSSSASHDDARPLLSLVATPLSDNAKCLRRPSHAFQHDRSCIASLRLRPCNASLAPGLPFPPQFPTRLACFVILYDISLLWRRLDITIYKGSLLELRHSAHHLMHCACGATELGDLQACTTIEVAGTPAAPTFWREYFKAERTARRSQDLRPRWQLTLGPFTTTLSGVYEQLGSSGAEVVSSVCVLPYRVFSFKKTRDRSAATPCTPASCQDSASGGSGPIHVASKDDALRDRGRKRCCTTERDVGSSRPLAPARARPCRAGKSLPYALLFSAPLPYSDGPQRRFDSVSVRFTSFYSLLHLA
ncbi:hypothetical protein B0H13DRAFT_2659937 [Mycena leptocephala]|nr:hypothetical protein B0H13DRAFT_2659937 [Mycena leptocephala]